MIPNATTSNFIRLHRLDDPRRLALQTHPQPGLDLQTALTQITGWQLARTKLPRWAATDGILFPPRLSMEQCSSELTAAYKAALVEGRTGKGRFIDLTGGFGVDCVALAGLFAEAHYVERQDVLCELAGNNFPLLGAGHIRVHRAECQDFLAQCPPADWIFIDPARRDAHGGKTVAIAQCEPDVTRLEDALLAKATRVMVKLSPMLDLFQALHELKHVEAAHVVAADNECKELLLVLGPNAPAHADDIPVCCANLHAQSPDTPLTFSRHDEQAATCRYATGPGRYLYEPNAALLKAGAFRTVAQRYNLSKLHPSSHLYTSDRLVEEGFPGRVFRLLGQCAPHRKEVARLLGPSPKANLAVRNFPAGVDRLYKQLGIAAGGDAFLFATTLADNRRILLWGERVTPL